MQQHWQSKACKIRKITLHRGKKKKRGGRKRKKKKRKKSTPPKKKEKKGKKANRLSNMSQKSGYQKLPKPSTTHPPGTSTAPPSGFSVKHRPCDSLGGSKPASMANVSQPPIKKHKNTLQIRPVPLLAKTKTCKILTDLSSIICNQ